MTTIQDGCHLFLQLATDRLHQASARAFLGSYSISPSLLPSEWVVALVGEVLMGAARQGLKNHAAARDVARQPPIHQQVSCMGN